MLISQIQRSFKLFFVSLTLCILFACQSQSPRPPSDILVDDLNLQNIDKQNETIKSAINKLEAGKILEAEILINQVLRFNQSHSTAKLLKRQLTSTSAVIFSTTRFTQYTIKSGDTLGSIAKHWLGNAIYFVSLVKLNSIKDPTQIIPGQLINIPVTNNSPLVKKEDRRSRANLALLKKYAMKKKYYKSLKRMTSIFIIEKHHQKLLALQEDTLIQFAESKVSISERQLMIKQVEQILGQSKTNLLTTNFNQFIQQHSLAVLLDEFVLLFEANSFEAAAEKLAEAKKIIREQQTDELNQSSTYYYRTEKLLINKLHEQAILLRKNQQLQKATDSWKLILDIQPDNDLALKYYHRTNRLLERLKNL